MITIKELRALIEARLAKRFPDNKFEAIPHSHRKITEFKMLGIAKARVCFWIIPAKKEHSSYIWQAEGFINWLAETLAAQNISGQHFLFLPHRKFENIKIYNLDNFEFATAYAAHLANQNPINIKP